VLVAAVSLGAEEVVRSILRHVERLVTITSAASVGALPIWVPQSTSTRVIELAHASVVIPSKVRTAAFLESGVHVRSRIGINVCWLVSIVQAPLSISFRLVIGIKQVD
jgi:hypothetical protein